MDRIIRLTRYGVLLDPPEWLVFDHDEGGFDAYTPIGLTTICSNDPDDTALVSKVSGEHGDEFEIIPEDEVPDEVWAKLALLRLTGDAS